MRVVFCSYRKFNSNIVCRRDDIIIAPPLIPRLLFLSVAYHIRLAASVPNTRAMLFFQDEQNSFNLHNPVFRFHNVALKT